MPRGMPANMRPMRPGERRVGRKKGVPNKTTRQLKEAIILAAETSKHSKTKDLVGYVKYLADSKPEIFASLLGRLLPLQAKMDVAGNVEHTIRAKPELQMTPQELMEYYRKLCQLPASAKPLVIDNDTGEPPHSGAAE